MERITVETKGERIDAYLSSRLDISRNKIHKLIERKDILVNDEKTKNSYIVKENDIISYHITEEETEVKGENIPLDIVYEDADVIVVNKTKGMVVHPAIGNDTGTLVNALIYHYDNLSNINGKSRPGIVHRIDADTTGLLMIAKNDKTHEFLSKQLSDQKVYRKYIALVWGVINEETGTIDAPIGRDSKDRKKMAVTSMNSKKAITHFKVLKRYKDVTLLELTLETGRTHQIRVHMDYINHPIVNDPVYGRRKKIDDTGQCLHAKELGFIHPKTSELMIFTSDLPNVFTNIENRFKDS